MKNKTLEFLYTFSTDEDLKRFRIFLVWTVIAATPSAILAYTIGNWQVHIPGVEGGGSSSNILVPMLIGSSILPILFTITGGLRGYHVKFNWILDKIFDRFQLKTADELEGEDYYLLTKQVDRARYFVGFWVLALIIIIFDISLYPLFGSMSGLGPIAYLSDNLLLDVLVFVLEGIYTVKDGLAAGSKVYKLKLPTIGNAE